LKSANQKLKLLFLYRILSEETDETEGLSLVEIINRLEKYNIAAERKSLYDDINQLNDSGYIEITNQREDNTVKYHATSRLFETVELRLLVDAVQSARFISAPKSGELIKKLTALTSTGEAKKLNCQIHMPNRIKTDNKHVIYGVNNISEAILIKKKISFGYTSYVIGNTPKGFERINRHNGKLYVISPYALVWDDENYYMIGFDEEAGIRKHYRVDRMTNIVITDEPRSGEEEFKNFDLVSYCQSTFSMYCGENQRVELECDNSMIEIIVDRFGSDVVISKKSNNSFIVAVRVMVSPVFFSWIFTFGGKIKIISPVDVVSRFREQAKAVLTSI